MRYRCRLTALLVCAFVWCSAAWGSLGLAATTKTIFVPEAGPVLAGPGLAWMEEDPSVRGSVLRSSGTSFPTGVAVGAAGGDSLETKLEASSSRLAIEAVTVFAADARTQGRRIRTLAAPAGGSLAPVTAECEVDESAFTRSIALQDSELASRGPECGQAALFGGDGHPSRLPDGVYGLRLAGPYVAWIESPADTRPLSPSSRPLVVKDRRTDREITRLAAGALPGLVIDLALQEDGTLLVLYSTADPTVARVARVAPGQSVAATLPQRFASQTRVRVADERLAAVVLAENASGRLSVIDTATGARLSSGPILRDSALFSAFDYDGTRFALTLPRCRGVDLVVAPEAAFRAVKRCSLRFDRPPKLNRGRLRLDFSCAGLATGCAGLVDVTLGDRVIARGQSQAGGSASLSIRRSLRSRVRAGTRVRVTVSNAANGAPIGRERTTTARVRR